MKVQRRCSECGEPLTGRRDRQTCSTACRMARSRRLESRRVLHISRRSLSYVEDHDAFQRGRQTGRGRYEFTPEDGDHILGILTSWAGTLASEAGPDRQTRDDLRALRADLEANA